MLGILCIILGVIFCLMMIIGIIYNISYDVYGSVYITIGVILLLSCILSGIDKTEPTAIDVYRGKTTLEITYKDGVAIDSTVVFKEK